MRAHIWKNSDYINNLVDNNVQIIQKASEIILQNLNDYQNKKKKIRTIYELEKLAEILNKAFAQNKICDEETVEDVEIKIKLPKFQNMLQIDASDKKLYNKIYLPIFKSKKRYNFIY